MTSSIFNPKTKVNAKVKFGLINRILVHFGIKCIIMYKTGCTFLLEESKVSVNGKLY